MSRRPWALAVLVLWTLGWGAWAAARGRRASQATLTSAQGARDRLREKVARDLARLKDVAKDPSVLAWARAEEDADARSKAAETLERARLDLSQPEAFIALETSRHFYFLKDAQGLAQPAYTLNLQQPADAWYAAPGLAARGFTLNVDEDRVLKVARVWINVRMADAGGTAGVLGTGLDLDGFLADFYQPGDPPVVLMTRRGEIQLHPDRRFTFLNTARGRAEGMLTIRSLVREPETRDQLLAALDDLAAGRRAEATVPLRLGERQMLAGVLYLPDLDWYLVALHPPVTLPWAWMLPAWLAGAVALLLLARRP